jgi:hypothetical protein
MGGIPIEDKPSGQGASQSPESFDCVFPPAITADFKLPGPRDPNFDLISVLQLQSFDHRCGKPYS